MPEEEAFAVLVKIMYAYNLRELFKPSMAELGLRMFQLESMIQVCDRPHSSSAYVSLFLLQYLISGDCTVVFCMVIKV